MLYMTKKPAIRAVARHAFKPRPVPVAKSISIMAARLTKLMEETPGKNSARQLEQYLKSTSARTVDNIKTETYDIFETLDDIASAFHLPAWVLICPIDSAEIRDILSVYGDTSDQGRELIKLAVETARKLKGD